MSNIHQVVFCRKDRTDETILMFRGEDSALRVYNEGNAALNDGTNLAVVDDFGLRFAIRGYEIGSVLLRSLNGQHEGWVEVQLAETRAKKRLQEKFSKDEYLNSKVELVVPAKPALVHPGGQRL